jgi:hypothetical protein
MKETGCSNCESGSSPFTRPPDGPIESVFDVSPLIPCGPISLNGPTLARKT